jgi:hypothetical protein
MLRGNYPRVFVEFIEYQQYYADNEGVFQQAKNDAPYLVQQAQMSGFDEFVEQSSHQIHEDNNQDKGDHKGEDGEEFGSPGQLGSEEIFHQARQPESPVNSKDKGQQGNDSDDQAFGEAFIRPPGKGYQNKDIEVIHAGGMLERVFSKGDGAVWGDKNKRRI